MSLGFPTKSDTNQAIQPQMMTIGLTIRKYGDCTIYVVTTKVLISCTAIVQLICVFVLHMRNTGFLMTWLI